MLNTNKKTKMISSIKNYKKTYLDKQYVDLDESATRLMVNHFLTEILGYKMIEEIKTEFMIRGTYADYVIQINGIRHFLVEVKALSLELSEKHLRQALNYAANEGIDWVVLTNGRKLDLYKVLFEKPIECKKVFSIDLMNTENFKEDIDFLEYLHRENVLKKELDTLWKKHSALKPSTLAGYLFAKPIVNYLKKELKAKYKSGFSDDEIIQSIRRIITESTPLDTVKVVREKKVVKAEPIVTTPIESPPATIV